MEIRITTAQVLKVLQVFSWIIFLGLCIVAGSIASHATITLFIGSAGVAGTDYLSLLLQMDKTYFLVLTIIMTIVAVFKAVMFYLIIKIFVSSKVKISQPFIPALRRFLVRQSSLALGIGLFSYAGFKYTLWLTQQGLPSADLQSLNLSGADVWMFMAVILFLIAQLVQKGIEIQTDNDLTI